jgi:hypothetical protein
MISNAGRMVCAVVCAAPDTMPSASPRCTIIVPKYETSVMVSAAFSYVMPLCAQLAYSSAKRCTICGSNGLSTCAALRSRPSSTARHADLRLVAEDRQVGDAAGEHRGRRPQHAVVAALGQHDALAAGAGALQELVLEHQRRHDGGVGEPRARVNSSVSTCCSNRASAVS